MSQAGEIDVVQNHPEIPTIFEADVGFAVPIANTIEILAESVAAGSVPAQTVASGNTVTTQIQTSQAIAATDATKIGLSAFNEDHFVVDVNGFVSLNGTAVAETITGDTGGAISPTAGNWNIITGQSTYNSGSSVGFAGSVSTLTLNVTDANFNTMIGLLAGNSTITGVANVALGVNAGASLAGGGTNVMIGSTAGNLLDEANDNVLIGQSAGQFLTDGSSNTIIGSTAGSLYNGSESFNILIGVANSGVTAESGVIRIGKSGAQTECYVAGISGVSVATPQMVTIDPATGQLGSAVGTVSSWVEETGATRALLVNQGVVGNRGTAQTFTLPSTAPQFSIIRIVQVGAGAITIAQNAGDQIRFGSSTTTAGVGGSLTSTSVGDAIELINYVANDTWGVLSSVGTWTPV